MPRFSFLSFAFVVVASLLLAMPRAEANWLTSLTKGTGKAASHAHPHANLGAIGKAAGHLAELPAGPKIALAAHATPEGHWQFANRDGQTFTAGTPDEFNHVLPSLVPDAAAAGDAKLALYLSEDSVFANRGHLDKLPKDADLNLVTDQGAFPIARNPGGKLTLIYKPNVILDIEDQGLLQETLSTLSRPLNKSNIRTIAAQPGASTTLSSAPKRDGLSKVALVDELDPAHLTRAFSSIRGQTALIVARIDKGKIVFQPSKGGEISRELDEVLAAASQNDVNLVLLRADAPRQPGGRNWLWQKIEVGGLDEAIGTSTYGDFLDALGAKRAPMLVSASRESLGRVRISAVADETKGPLSSAGNAMEEVIGHVTGEVVSAAVDLHARDDSSQREIDGRIIPGIPSYLQIPYLVGLVTGFLGWPVSRRWWHRLWPPPERGEGQSRLRHWAQGAPNFLVYSLVFLPIAGVPALLWQAAQQAWATVTAPFRWLAKLFRRRAEV